jgi:hypothetical protein
VRRETRVAKPDRKVDRQALEIDFSKRALQRGDAGVAKRVEAEAAHGGCNRPNFRPNVRP